MLVKVVCGLNRKIIERKSFEKSETIGFFSRRNSLYGTTNNPYDLTRIVGGSSGGAGCIVSAAGVPFAIGADIGGSIRLPSFMNGIFGHKTTPGKTENPPLEKRDVSCVIRYCSQ